MTDEPEKTVRVGYICAIPGNGAMRMLAALLQAQAERDDKAAKPEKDKE